MGTPDSRCSSCCPLSSHTAAEHRWPAPRREARPEGRQAVSERRPPALHRRYEPPRSDPRTQSGRYARGVCGAGVAVSELGSDSSGPNEIAATSSVRRLLVAHPPSAASRIRQQGRHCRHQPRSGSAGRRNALLRSVDGHSGARGRVHVSRVDPQHPPNHHRRTGERSEVGRAEGC